jgi:hypothetical protein
MPKNIPIFIQRIKDAREQEIKLIIALTSGAAAVNKKICGIVRQHFLCFTKQELNKNLTPFLSDCQVLLL